MKLVLLTAAAVLLMAAGQAYDFGDARDDGGDAKAKAVCRQVKTIAIPAADRPSAQVAASLKGCDAEDLYYGIEKPADEVKARQCAYAQLNTPDDSAFYGSRAILATIYANGAGVPKNIDLAIHFSCGIEDAAPAEHEGRIAHLQEMKKAGAKPFDFCDDVTSGYAEGFCASHVQDIAKVKRRGDLAKIKAKWTPAELTAFDALEKAGGAFVTSHAENEVDVSGSGRAVFIIEAEEEAATSFMALLKRLDAGQGPGAVAGLAAADKRLNDVYRQVQNAKDPDWGTVKKTGIRDAQRVWIRYRDAWLAFAKTKYPAVSQDALATALTNERVKALEEFKGG